MVVPDLESAAVAYLGALRSVRAREPGATGRHEWMILELVDQLARHKPGGEYSAFLRLADLQTRAFALERCGLEVSRLLDEKNAQASRIPSRLDALLRMIRRPATVLHAVKRKVLGQAWSVGHFRLSGEGHQWMYDCESLARRLVEAGFRDIRAVHANESRVPGWRKYLLDADSAGRAHKPDSLFVEAVKPGV